ncbi:MAG TPA: hypothetical protein VHX20_01720 [Terracidiphilus sp.]|jgi:hypothetical protein|nr:hypothetical protein [Terracidiphilus sp.]
MTKETENAGTGNRAGSPAGGPIHHQIDDPIKDQINDQAPDRIGRAVRIGGIGARSLLPLPGLAAIALYLMVLAGVIILGVVSGGHYPPVFLIFSVLFIASSAGMLMLFRWAWSLALAAVMMLAGYNLFVFAREHQAAALVQGLLNLVFFLYLVRSEVREVLR